MRIVRDILTIGVGLLGFAFYAVTEAWRTTIQGKPEHSRHLTVTVKDPLYGDTQTLKVPKNMGLAYLSFRDGRCFTISIHDITRASETGIKWTGDAAEGEKMLSIARSKQMVLRVRRS